MKKFIHKSLLVALCSSAVVGCQPTLKLVDLSPGSADFSNYVSIGDGTPGGYADAGLSKDAQLVAFPNLLAQQFALIDGPKGFHAPFVQPIVVPYVGISGHTFTSFGYENGKPGTRYHLGYRTLCKGTGSDTIRELHPEMEDSTMNLFDIPGFKVELPPAGGHYNNLAAQGTKMIYVNRGGTEVTNVPGGTITGWAHLHTGSPTASSTASTYWQKISSTPTSTMLSDAVVAHPTFVTINVGGVDVLRFAKSGGFGTLARDPLATSATPGGDDDMITPLTEFTDSLDHILKTLTAGGTNGLKGAIANIIGPESFPYFTYLKYDGLVLTAEQAAELNNLPLYAGQGFTFQTGRNAYVIGDLSATNTCHCRQIKSDELILIEIQDSLSYCYGTGSKVPLWHRWVLDEGELSTIQSYITSYNAALKAAADKYNFAYVDSHYAIQQIVKPGGSQYEGITITNEFVNGNQFGLDGLDISPLGQATSANAWLNAINIKYGSSIPGVDATKYSGVIFH